MNPFVSVCVLCAECHSKFTEPHVVVKALSNPDGTGVIGMSLLVGVLREFVPRRRNPVCGIQELRSFEDHLYDMLVAMIFRGGLGVERKEEDIHCRYGSLAWTNQIRLAAVERGKHCKDHRVGFLVKGNEKQKNVG